jgi:hypothetical protein
VASLYAAKGDGEAAASWLGEAVKLGTGYDAVQARTVFLDLWEKDAAAFKSFVGDAFGATAASDMSKRLKARQAKLADERHAAAEKTRAEQAAREKRQREEQLAQEQSAREAASQPLRAQLRKPVVAELDRLLRACPPQRIGYGAERKFFGGYDKNFDEYYLSIGLQGSGYVATSTWAHEHWNHPGTKNYETKTYTFDSFSSLTAVKVEPFYAASEIKDAKKHHYGSIEKWWRVGITFAGRTVAVVSREMYSDSPKNDQSSGIYGDFMINDPADGPRIAALFVELKAIDSLTLEQLREKAGGV